MADSSPRLPETVGVTVPLLATQLLWINLLTDAALRTLPRRGRHVTVLFERGAQLFERCRAELNRARQSIERIRVEDGEVKRQTSDASASEAPIPSADTLNEDDLPF